jgi:hypothetical protein
LVTSCYGRRVVIYDHGEDSWRVPGRKYVEMDMGNDETIDLSPNDRSKNKKYILLIHAMTDQYDIYKA